MHVELQSASLLSGFKAPIPLPSKMLFQFGDKELCAVQNFFDLSALFGLALFLRFLLLLAVNRHPVSLHGTNHHC